jgi:hypothetical protein
MTAGQFHHAESKFRSPKCTSIAFHNVKCGLLAIGKVNRRPAA